MLATAYIPAGCCCRCCCCCCCCCATERANETISPTIPLAFRLGSTLRCFSSISRWVDGRPDRGGGQVRSVFVVGAIYLFLVFEGGENSRQGGVTSSMTSQRWPTHFPNGGTRKWNKNKKREREENKLREFTGAMAGQVAVFSPFGQLPSGRSGVVHLARPARPVADASDRGRRHCIRTGAWISFPFHPNGWRKQANTQSVGEREKTWTDKPLGTRKKSMIFRSMAPLSRPVSRLLVS